MHIQSEREILFTQKLVELMQMKDIHIYILQKWGEKKKEGVRDGVRERWGEVLDAEFLIPNKQTWMQVDNSFDHHDPSSSPMLSFT